MPRKEISKREFARIATNVIFGAVLAACTPEGRAQETRPAVTQTVDSPVSTLTNEELRELITKPMTPTPTKQNTATPEASPTPQQHRNFRVI